MGPSKEELKKFQVAYEVIYGKELSEKEAFDKFMRFSNLVDALRKMYTKSE